MVSTVGGWKDSARGGESQSNLFDLLARFVPLLFLIVLMIVFATLQPRFLSSANLFIVLRQVSIYGLLAIGMTFVILTTGIDLSIGSMLAFAGLIAAVVSKGGTSDRFADVHSQVVVGNPWYLAALAAILIGLAGGLIQGLAITRLKVPAFVVTLGGMSAFRGAALLIAAGGPISGFEPGYVWWGQAHLGPVPVPVIVFLSCAVIAHIVLRYTRYGRRIYAIGGNAEAARLSGLNVRRLTTSVYVVMGFFVGLGSFILSARLDSSEAIAGSGYELTVIASVVIGGASLFGGVGTIFGTVIGTVLMGVLLNGLVMLSVSSYIQQIIVGIIIILAVAFDTFAKSRRRTN